MSKDNRDPEAPCACGSGIRYADCHQPIIKAPRTKRIAVGQRLYAQDWAINAQSYQSQGLYSALAEELVAGGDIRRVLDIGCGLGHGLIALLAQISTKSRRIIGIDENPQCLVAAAERLSLPSSNLALDRLSNMGLLSGAYDTKVRSDELVLSGDVMLVNVDLMIPDIAFETWLDKIGPLDALTLWFSGVHKARSFTKLVQHFNIKSDADHRRVLEERVFQFAQRRLRPGGIVQMVNRFAGADLEALRLGYEQTITSALDGWPFEVLSVTSMAYYEPKGANAIQVGSTSFDASGQPTAAFSVLTRYRPIG